MDEISHRMRLRAAVILALMFAVVLQLGYLFSYLAGSQAGGTAIAVGVALALIADLYVYFASDRIAIRLGARVVTPDEAPELHQLVDELVLASGLPKPQVAILNDDSMNAFATGRNPEHALIAVNTGLLRALNRDELRGVLAHEMGHIYNRDIMFSAIAAMAVQAVAIPASVMIYLGAGMATYSSGGRKTKEQQQAETASRLLGLAILLLGGLIALTLVPALNVLKMALGRSRERLADLAGAQFTRDPESLANALQRISQDSTPSSLAESAAAALCIIRPKAFRGSWWQDLMSTHPDPQQRIDTLRSMAAGRTFNLAMEQKSKSYSGLLLMGLLALGLVAVPGYALSQRGPCSGPFECTSSSTSNDTWSDWEEDPTPSDQWSPDESTEYVEEDPYADEEYLYEDDSVYLEEEYVEEYPDEVIDTPLEEEVVEDPVLTEPEPESEAAPPTEEPSSGSA